MISESSRTTLRYLSDLYLNGTAAGLSDSELLDRFTGGRNEQDESAELAFAAILARHGPMVLRVCRAVLGERHEVEDAFQATFLVLAVRARSIRRRGSLASWLHGVALRVAAAERSRAARRQRHELVWTVMNSSIAQDTGSDPVRDGEISMVIQEEIGRLPEKHRTVVVLCYLEGLTHEMAAERLSWPVGSVKSRLAWARERLRVRLTRRGVAPMSLSADRFESSRNAEPDPIPVVLGTRLAETTLRGALKAAMGKGALAGIASAEAVALMEATIRSMAHSRLMLAATAALAAALATAGLGTMGYAALRQENPRRAIPPIPQAAVRQAPPRLTGAKPVADQGPVVIQVDVVDSDGHRLAGADAVVRLFYPRNSGNSEQVVERSKTDGAGHVQFEAVRERQGGIMSSARVWAYQPGRALATSSVLLTGGASPTAIQLRLNEPAKWTITVLGADDRPIGGLRLMPHSVRHADRRTALPIAVDKSLEELLTVTTDGKGIATLTYLEGNMTPLSIGIDGRGVAPHTLPLDVSQGKNVVLRLGRPGRVVGIVRTASGAPLAGVPVELWVQGSGTLPSGVRAVAAQRITGNAIVRLERDPLKTGPQGVFQTPSTLLNGLTYRVSIRKDGFVPFISDWVTLSSERAAIPDIRLKPLQKLTGRINDRQGRAIAGARAFLPAGGPATATDAQGRFVLAGIDPGRAIILVEKTGFRLQGWLVDPSLQPELGSLTLVRTSETADPVMKPLADPIPLAESRALANRLLKPYLPDELENADDEPRLSAIVALSEFDVDRALELFENGKFRDEGFRYQDIRGALAVKLAVKDPARAEAMAESVPNPMMKVRNLSGVFKALPASEPVRKQAVLERATTLLRDRLQQANAAGRLRMIPEIAEIAEQWLDMGERDRARPLLDEGKTLNDDFQARFLGQLGRLEPTEVIPRLQRFSAPRNNNPNYRNDMLAEVAVQLATDRPALAEQVFNLRDSSGDQNQAVYTELRLCRRLARVDPATARRVAASLIGTGTRACAWASVAAGLAEKDKAGASEALDHAIQEIDRLRESGPGPESVYIINGIRLMPPTNPAAQILPIVERIAPERLAEVFWRAVALHPRIETEREDQLQTSYIGKECVLLARYDREVAAVLFEPLDSYLQTPAARHASVAFVNVAMMAKGCIDPRAAVALIESMTPPGRLDRSNPVQRARLSLAEMLGRSAENRWKERWRFMGAQFDD